MTQGEPNTSDATAITAIVIAVLAITVLAMAKETKVEHFSTFLVSLCVHAYVF